MTLKRDLQKTRRSAYAEGTQKNHRTQWRAYLLFCHYFSFCAVPASTEVLSLYCQFLSRNMTPESVRNYLSGVKLLHIILGESVSQFLAYEIKITLRGIERLARHVPVRAPPVTPELLLAIARNCDFSNGRDVVLLCAFSFTFFLFARVSNIVPLSLKKFDSSVHLCREDISRSSSGLLVTFKWSKTMQCGKRVLSLPLLPIPGSRICPVRLYHLMCQLIPSRPRMPAFVLLDTTEHSFPLTKSVFVREFRDRLTLAGIPHALTFRGHSFRRGATTWAFKMGIPGEFIQVYGDWVSEAYKSYLEFSMSCKLQVAHKMRTSLLCLAGLED